MTEFRLNRTFGQAKRSKGSPKKATPRGSKYDVPGGALLLAPEIPSGCAIAAFVARKCELVHNWRHRNITAPCPAVSHDHLAMHTAAQANRLRAVPA